MWNPTLGLQSVRRRHAALTRPLPAPRLAQSSPSVTEPSCDLASQPVLCPGSYSASPRSPRPFARSPYVTVPVTASGGTAALGGTAGSRQPGRSRMTLAGSRVLPGPSGASGVKLRRGAGAPRAGQGAGVAPSRLEGEGSGGIGHFTLLSSTRPASFRNWGATPRRSTVPGSLPAAQHRCGLPPWGAAPSPSHFSRANFSFPAAPCPLARGGGTRCRLRPPPCGSAPASLSTPGCCRG